MLNFIPALVMLIISIGVVPFDKFPMVLFVSSLCYVLIAVLYKKYISDFSKRVPLVFVLTFYSLLVSSLLIFIFYPAPPYNYPNDPKVYHDMAKNMVEYKSYSWVVKQDDGVKLYPTAYRSVGYPMYISLFYFVTNSFNYKVVTSSQLVLNLLSLYLFWKIVSRLYSKKFAETALVLYSLNISLLFLANTFMSETITQFLILLASWLFVYKFPKKLPVVNGLLLGLICSYSVLVRPNLLFYVPLIALILFFKVNKKSAISFTLSALMVLGLWGYRNYLHSGKFIFTSTNGGINLYLGNNDYVINGRASNWAPTQEIARIIGSEEDARDNAKLHNGFVFDGLEKEIRYNNAFKKEAISWVLKNPVKFSKLALSRASFLFSPYRNFFLNLEHFNLLHRFQYYFLLSFHMSFVWALLFLMFIGVFDKKHLTLVLLTAPYVFVIVMIFTDTRYQVPMYIPISILAAGGVEKILNFKKNIKWVVVAFVIFLFQFGMYKSDLITLLKYSAYYGKMANAEGSLSEPLIKKTYAEDRYLAAKLKNENDGVTVDPGILSNVEGLSDEILIYKNISTNGLPIFRIGKISDEKLTGAAIIGENIASPIKNKQTKVFAYLFREDFKYVRIIFRLYKHSSIEIDGKSKILISGYPADGDSLRSDLFIPRNYFYNGIEVYLKSEEFPKDSSLVPINEIYKTFWDPSLAVIESIQLVN